MLAYIMNWACNISNCLEPLIIFVVKRNRWMTWKTKMIILDNFRNLDWNIILNFISVFQWRLNHSQLVLNNLKSVGFRLTVVISKSEPCSKKLKKYKHLKIKFPPTSIVACEVDTLLNRISLSSLLLIFSWFKVLTDLTFATKCTARFQERLG